VSPSCAAIAAASADYVSFAADDLADFDVADVVADFFDGSDEFVARDKRGFDCFLRPAVPVVDVDVGAADSGLLDFDEDVVAADRRNGHFFGPDSGFGSCFHKRFHSFVSPARR